MTWAVVCRRGLVAVAVGLLCLLAGCGGCPRERPTDAYYEGAGLFLAGEHGASERQLRDFLAQHASSPHASDAHCLLGSIALQQGRTREAETHFRTALASPRTDQMRASASLGLARCHLRRGEYPQGIAVCRDFLAAHPASPRADEALYVLAEAYDRDGQRAQARSYYAQVKGRFPSGAWASKAAARLRGESLPPEPASGGRHTLQIAALLKPSSAEDHAARLRERGYPAFVVAIRADGRTLYAVRVGPYAERDAAERVAARLKRDGYDALVKP